MKWIEWKDGCPLPEERRFILWQIDKRTVDNMEMPPAVGVGYMRVWSCGPWFVIPGMGGKFVVNHYCDCLGDDFNAPLWGVGNKPKGETR